MRTARSVSVVPWLPVVFGLPPDPYASIVVVVGHGENPDSSAAVRGTNVGRGEHSPFRIEPEVGKVGEDVR